MARPGVRMKQRILIVEDSEDLSQMIEMALESQGYDVHCEPNGFEALNYLSNHEEIPDLILLDLMMPIMDGYEFRRKQLEDPQYANIPVVILTADGGFSNPEVMKAQALLRKPADLRSILGVVHEQLDSWIESKLG